MPSSLIVVALVVAWLVVLVPMVVRKRQEIARTADSALAARVVRSGVSHDLDDSDEAHDHDEAEDTREDFAMSDADEVDTELDELDADELDAPQPARRYRPGRGGYDPEAAARSARAKYGFRQRVVLLMIVLAIISAVTALAVTATMWWAHGAIDVALVGYLTYLRRQVRIEEEIRQRRYARMTAVHRSHARPIEDEYEDEYDEEPPFRQYARVTHPGAVVIDIDDEDPWFDHLGHPDDLPYRRAVGE
ncbi:PROBABLE CONSERVED TRANSMEMBRANE PROTEIN [Alloactinosynnema sp. L-07]|uniref:divisome protein SepX/GlpR n=1 Tax=Alloactinosynnema sp. L-07 TaxID=1653480 RepID=UPI00065F07F1|nr:gephyrin-like molybdotransferase receptor GlpR [Alloactinosynnema sp. L-07]CRK61442.1 PROBABLE CONSERVED TRANSMEMBRANE PROTEIN [Alloactinosynnema sp. L-07]